MIFEELVWSGRVFVLFDGGGSGILFEKEEFDKWPYAIPSAYGVVRFGVVYKDEKYLGNIKSKLDLMRENKEGNSIFVPRPKMTPEQAKFYDLYGIVPTDKQLLEFKRFHKGEIGFTQIKTAE